MSPPRERREPCDGGKHTPERRDDMRAVASRTMNLGPHQTMLMPDPVIMEVEWRRWPIRRFSGIGRPIHDNNAAYNVASEASNVQAGIGTVTEWSNTGCPGCHD